MMQVNVKALASTLLVGLVVLTACADEPPRLTGLRGSCEGCNVILISLDTLRADHLGAYGYERNSSPELDAVANQSVLFERCFAQAPTTLPSHMSIFTGLYPRRHGVLKKSLVLSDRTPTLASLLRERGYATAAFTGGGFVRERFGYHGFDRFEHSDYWDASYRSENDQFEEMLGWVDARSEPFFLFWHSYRVHSPYNPPPKADRFSDPAYDGIVVVDPDIPTEVCDGVEARGCQWKGLPYFQRILDRMNREDVQHVVDKYDGELLSLDALVGRLWKQLEARSLLENSVVVIVSDHGETFAERERNAKIGHGLPYREVLHVPLIVYAPGLEAGRRRAEIVETIDLMPTVLDLVGVTTPAGLDGQSLANGTIAHGRRFAFAESWRGNDLKAVSVIGGQHHLIDWSGEQDEIFDLSIDSLEHRNLIKLETAAVERLRQIARRIGERPPAATVRGEVLDDETLHQLDALGYL